MGAGCGGYPERGERNQVLLQETAVFQGALPDLYPRCAPTADSQIEQYNTEDPNGDDDDEVLLMERWYKPGTARLKRTVAGGGSRVPIALLERDETRRAGVYEDGLFLVVMPLYPLDDTPSGFPHRYISR